MSLFSSPRSLKRTPSIHSQSSTNSPNSIFSRLENLLVQKTNEIQLAGRLGETLLSQHTELESKIREIHSKVQANNEENHVELNRRSRSKSVEPEGEEQQDDVTLDVGEEAKKKLEELEDEVRHWERENEEIFKSLGINSHSFNGTNMSNVNRDIGNLLLEDSSDPVRVRPTFSHPSLTNTR
jgi:hypothetical protein